MSDLVCHRCGKPILARHRDPVATPHGPVHYSCPGNRYVTRTARKLIGR